MYNENKGGALGLYVEKTVKKVAMRHTEIAEEGWNLMGNELSNRIHNYEAHIHIPNNQTELRAWAHGPLNGNIKLIDKTDIQLTVSDIFPNTAFDTRFVFDLTAIPTSNKTTNVTALPMILNVESKKAEEAIRLREEFIDGQFQIVEMALDKVESTKRPSDLNEAQEQLHILACYPTDG